MSELRLNPMTGRWVTIVAERAHRPSDFAPRTPQVEADPGRPCPFCPGNEEATPPALETYGTTGEWALRVVPNRFPAFEGSDPMTVKNLGPVLLGTGGLDHKQPPLLGSIQPGNQAHEVRMHGVQRLLFVR